MATGMYSWSQTAASNSTADTAINWAEGQLPSTVNDSARGMMSIIAKWRDDISGVQPSNVVQTSAGAANVQTLSTNTSIATLTNGWTLTFKAGYTSTAACTLNVDALGAKSIQRISGTALVGGEIIAGCVYTVTYHQPADAWVLHSSATSTTLTGNLSAATYSLGTASSQAADLFLEEGGVINWDNGDATITQTSNDITIAGITTFGVGTSTAVTLGTIELGDASDTTISRTGAGAVAVEGVGVALNSTSLTHTASTIELGHASDTTLSRSAAGTLAVEGVDVVTTARNPWKTVFKTANETLATNTTFQDDDALTFAVLANTKYAFRVYVFYDTPVAADFKWQFTGPAAATLISYRPDVTSPDGTDYVYLETGGFSTSASITGGSGTAGYFAVNGVLQNGANAGSVTLQWAQVSSSGTTTVYAGSYLEYAVVA